MTNKASHPPTNAIGILRPATSTRQCCCRFHHQSAPFGRLLLAFSLAAVTIAATWPPSVFVAESLAITPSPLQTLSAIGCCDQNNRRCDPFLQISRGGDGDHGGTIKCRGSFSWNRIEKGGRRSVLMLSSQSHAPTDEGAEKLTMSDEPSTFQSSVGNDNGVINVLNQNIDAFLKNTSRSTTTKTFNTPPTITTSSSTLETTATPETNTAINEDESLSMWPQFDDLDKRMIKIALPCIANFAINPLIGAVDLFWVNRMGNALAVAGQAAANQVFSSAFWVVSFLPSGKLLLLFVGRASF